MYCVARKHLNAAQRVDAEGIVENLRTELWAATARLERLSDVRYRLSRMTPHDRNQMTLRQFIEDHHEDVIRQFATFARTLMPPGSDMSDQGLRDHAEELLKAIAVDMMTAQSLQEQSDKSMGWGTAHAMRASECCTPTPGSSMDEGSPQPPRSQSFAPSVPRCCICTR